MTVERMKHVNLEYFGSSLQIDAGFVFLDVQNRFALIGSAAEDFLRSSCHNGAVHVGEADGDEEAN